MEGRVALVTGGANGIGEACVRRLRAAGAHVIVADLAGGDLDLDVRDEAAVAAAIGSLGRLDIAVNNAGISGDHARAGDLPTSAWRAVMDVNLKGPYRLCRLVIPMMVDHGGGAIVNVSSVAGVRGFRGGAAYTASKHALIGLTRNIAATHGAAGVRCIG